MSIALAKQAVPTLPHFSFIWKHLLESKGLQFACCLNPRDCNLHAARMPMDFPFIYEGNTYPSKIVLPLLVE